jgi:hypothetical protein
LKRARIVGSSRFDEDEESEVEERKSNAVRESDFTPLQFNILHIMAITALFGLAFGMYRLVEDLSHEQMQILYAWGSVGFAVLLVAAIFGLCRRG